MESIFLIKPNTIKKQSIHPLALVSKVAKQASTTTPKLKITKLHKNPQKCKPTKNPKWSNQRIKRREPPHNGDGDSLELGEYKSRRLERVLTWKFLK